MDTFESLSHSVWECKYHVVFIPKCRRKTLYGTLRKHVGEVFRTLAQQKESRIEEGGRLRLVALIEQASVVQRILRHLAATDPRFRVAGVALAPAAPWSIR